MTNQTPKIFFGSIILPQVLNLGFFSIRWYGVILAFAVAVGLFISLKRAAKYRIEKESAENIFVYIIMGGFIGARVWHIFSVYGYYLVHPEQVFFVWNGGLAIYGAIFGGLFGLWLYNYLQAKKYKLLTLLDWLTPGLIVAQAIGRFGNWFNYELYGYPTSLPWKMFVPETFRVVGYESFSFFHPLFLYEAFGLLLILIFVYWLEKKPYFKESGRLFFSYFLLYNIVRFFIEILRVDTTLIAGIRVNLLLSLVFVVLSALAIYFANETRHS